MRIASDETVSALADRVKTIEDDYLKDVDKTELSDAIAAEKERAEGVEDDLQAAIDAINNEDNGVLAQAKAYADGKDEAIAAAKKSGDDAQAAVEALENGTVATLRSDVDALQAVTYTEITADEIDAMFAAE